jgi:hypothetical protein
MEFPEGRALIRTGFCSGGYSVTRRVFGFRWEQTTKGDVAAADFLQRGTHRGE